MKAFRQIQAVLAIGIGSSLIFISLPSHVLAAPSEGETFLQLPCGDKPEEGLRPCAEVSKMIAEKVHQIFDNKINGIPAKGVKGLYQGCDFDRSADKMDPLTGCYGPPYPTPVCNPIPGPFNAQTEEKETNHFGQSCGEWTFIEARRSGKKVKVTPNEQGRRRDREEGYSRGAWIQSLTCFTEQVKKEILDQKKLRIVILDDEVGPCGAMVRDFDARFKTNGKYVFNDKFTTQINRFKSQGNVQNTEECRKADENKAQTAGLGSHQLSPCDLLAARESLYFLVAQIAACEVSRRAQLSYDNFAGAFFDQDVAAARREHIKNECSDNKSSDKINRCYQNQYMRIFMDSFQPWWKSDGSSCRMF